MTAAGKRLLVVEDEYTIAKGFARDLRVLGLEVVGPAPSTPHALALVGTGALDGAVLDVNLRDELAFPIADALAERGIPFVFATGCPAEAVPERYAGVPRFDKPVDALRIVGALFPD